MMLSVFADAIVAILLVATISYAAVLNRRLGVLRSDRAKLEELVQGLTVASMRAESGIAGLKTTVADVGRQLEKKIEAAQGLRDDLAYMIERGGTVADRLEGTLRARRDDRAEPRHEAPRHELRSDPRPDPRPEPRAEPRRDAIAQITELRPELRARPAPKAERPVAEPERAAPAPSRAERDLLRALSSLR